MYYCICVLMLLYSRSHTSAYVGIRQHTSAYVSIRQILYVSSCYCIRVPAASAVKALLRLY